jgi:protein DGCR14
MSEKESEEEFCDCDHLSLDLIDPKSGTIRTKGVKNKRKVLEEEKYVNHIEDIIERDFFPDLSKLRAQLDYRKAVENNDFAQIKLLEYKFRIKSLSNRPLTNSSTFGFNAEPNSPTTFETPVRTTDSYFDSNNNNNRIDEQSSCGKQIDLSNSEKDKELGLDQFLNKYTSEDNASFEQIQEEEEKKHRMKYRWLYQDVRKNNNSVKQLLELPSIESQASIEDKKPLGAITWTFTNKNSVMYNPDGAQLTDEEKFANIKQQEVVHENTRFKVMPFNERLNQMAIASAAQLQSKLKEGKVGVDGKELVAKETPQINGFKFVASTPSPAPHLCSQSPFMTWGEIEGTPFSLDGSDTPLHPGLTPGTAQFKIPDLPHREKIGLSLANKAAKQHRDKKKQAIQRVQSSLSIPSPSFNSSKTPLERLNSMSPAAQKLATTKLGLNKNTDQSLLASYSPAHTYSVRTPGSTPKSMTSNSPLTPTPVYISTKKIENKRSSNFSSITDNLSNKPKRPKASEFF